MYLYIPIDQVIGDNAKKKAPLDDYEEETFGGATHPLLGDNG